LSSFFLWTTVGGLFRYFIDWFKKRNDVLILEKENMAGNLAVLKSQINPHFLYNTLHNIDALIYEDRDKASKSLEKLSDIMRYMLSDTQSDFVDLQKELDYLQNYLALEQLRLKSERFLNYTVSGDVEGFKIAPMILIPFVENAFKHSVDSNIENGIIIKIDVNKNRLSFLCENRFDPSDTDKDKGHGIGLENVKKRLSLIYGSNYNLSIDTVHSVFKVNLTIELNDN
jgi:LytS/YehU family sensor histidine kinase